MSIHLFVQTREEIHKRTFSATPTPMASRILSPRCSRKQALIKDSRHQVGRGWYLFKGWSYDTGCMMGISLVESSRCDDQPINLAQLRQLCEEDNPCEESIRPNVSDQAFEKRRQQTSHWMNRDQMEIPQVESPLEFKRRSQKERLRNLRRYLQQDGRFTTLIHQTRHMGRGRPRDKAIEEF
jgi:hypothetical protein